MKLLRNLLLTSVCVGWIVPLFIAVNSFLSVAKMWEKNFLDSTEEVWSFSNIELAEYFLTIFEIWFLVISFVLILFLISKIFPIKSDIKKDM